MMLIETKLIKYALNWWDSLQKGRLDRGLANITEWQLMKREMMKCFVPTNYEDESFTRLQNLRQRLSSVDTYTNEFYLLASRVLSVTLDEWSDDEIDAMVEVGGNSSANSIYEAFFPQGFSKPGPESNHEKRVNFIRLHSISSLFGFGIGVFPKKCLAIPFVQSRVTKASIAPRIDKIRSRATGWSGKLFSFQSRTVSEGGLGIHCLQDINDCMLMKLDWGFLTSKDPWVVFFRSKFLMKNGQIIRYFKCSSLWSGLKKAMLFVNSNSRWIIGNGEKIDFCRDCWEYDAPLIEVPPDTWNDCFATLSHLIENHSWRAPQAVSELLVDYGIHLFNIPLNNTDEDVRIWKHYPQGKFYVYSTFETLRQSSPKVWWFPISCATPFNLELALLSLNFVVTLLPLKITLLKEVVLSYLDALSAFLIVNMLVIFFGVAPQRDWICSLFQLYETKPVFDGTSLNITLLQSKLFVSIQDSANLSSGCMFNTCKELSIVSSLCVPTKPRPAPIIQRCRWILPWFEEIKINCVGSATGNPGKAGIGAIARSHSGEVLGVLIKGLGIIPPLYTECEAILENLSSAINNNWTSVWIEADSSATISAFDCNKVLWAQRARWNWLKPKFSFIRFSHIWREANFSYVQASKRGNALPNGITEAFSGNPDFITRVEEPHVDYFRFS
ncbi:hypothetical protein GIB67_015496 [Kingdonia uniflora]|uniref:RNase H type-1 domain-containing protein n=1 Tax=Kingdonia uniflora TaxID=39325 RepID=A0A7J7LAE8_9MAGN|nr:hypothetical protein GIB67_015496 [Kingdonia uniflora]